jgi:polyhydroxyalkanoate synthesis regulator phasin
MPQTPDWAKYLNAGAEFVAVTRSQARARAKVLVGQGQLAQEQVQGFVDDLVDDSRRRTDMLMDLIRQEIGRQVKTLGIATKDDLARLEARIISKSAPAKTAKKSGKKSTAKKTAEKSTAKKSAKKTAAKKTPAKQSATRAARAS